MHLPFVAMQERNETQAVNHSPRTLAEMSCSDSDSELRFRPIRLQSGSGGSGEVSHEAHEGMSKKDACVVE